jgi:urate oxidase
MYRMGLRALEAIPEISEVAMALPNLHYIPMNLPHFKLDNPDVMFLPANGPHGQSPVERASERLAQFD